MKKLNPTTPAFEACRLEALEPRLLMTGTPLISEFMASNNSTLADQDGESSDWVEIYNPTDATVNLEGYHLTDNAAVLAKWTLPAVDLVPGGRLVVFASGKDRAIAGSELHTNFRLNDEGEYLALVLPDGVTVANDFGAEYGPQRTDISFGLFQARVDLVQAGAAVHTLIPTAGNGGDLLGDTWLGGAAHEPFDDSGWITGTTGVGYGNVIQPPPLPGASGTAYNVPASTVGTQGYGGSLGMDFVVTRAITVSQLGVFDSGSNGLLSTITAQLYTRNGNAGALVPGASLSFTPASPGTLEGGSRFKDLAAPIVLQPGNYTISAYGYSASEPNGNSGSPTWSTFSGGGAISFVGLSRFGTAGAFPATPDGGPINRYAAGTFKFTAPGDPNPPLLTNGSFENPAMADHLPANGSPFVNTTVGWIQSGASSGAGSYNPADIQYPGATDQIPDLDTTIPDGRHIAFINSGSYRQSLNITLEPNTRYDLSAWFGSRIEVGTISYSLALMAGTEDVASVTNSLTGLGVWRHESFVFTTGTTHPQMGQPLSVELINTGATQVNVDKVEVSAARLVGTDLQTPMKNVNASAFMRIPFEVAQVANLQDLRLDITYDDGFVAWINGTEVARRNAPGGVGTIPAFNAAATASAGGSESINLSAFLSSLNDGTNILAIQGLNASASDSDFLIIPTLSAEQAVSGSRYFTTPTPGQPNAPVGYLGFVGDTMFDHDRGLYTDPFDVEITTDTPGANIYYTLDGSEPSPTHGTLYVNPVTITSTRTLRAAAFVEDFLPTDIDTQTYIFTSDIINQPANPAGFPLTWGGVGADYAMDSRVVTDPVYGPQMLAALASLPTISLVLNTADMFGPGGIYANPTASGSAWERPVSVEYFDPATGEQFQIDAGIRIAGAASRVPSESMKHSFRLYFRDEYGAGKLRFPLFEGSPVDQFDQLVLRANFGDSWNVPREHPKDSSFIRDQWMRDTFAEMGQVAPDGNFVHLYINGIYWGFYNPTERPNEDFMSDHFGGADEDYDVMNTGRMLSGDAVAWNTMMSLSSSYASDNFFDDTEYAAIQQYLDVENLADYVMLNIFAYNQDWFGGSKNFYAARPRTPGGQYKFFPWDSEHIFSIVGINRPVDTNLSDDIVAGTATQLFHNLKTNPQFKLMVADKIQKYMFNGGILTPEAVADSWLALASVVELATISESARWGDSKPAYNGVWTPTFPNPLWVSPLGQDDVLREQDRLLTTVFPTRTQIVLQQFINLGLYPNVAAPNYSQFGGQVAPGYELTITAPAGEIYYTTDGSDPYAPPTGAGAVSFINATAPVKALVPTIANGGDLLGAAWLGGDEPFNDGAWLTGTNGVGYDREVTYQSLINLNVRTQMDGISDSVFIRYNFNIADQSVIDELDDLILRVKYDDGFVAWLNGVEVASANKPTPLNWNSGTPGSHDDALALSYVDFDLSAFLGALVPGGNVLAIQGFNTTANGPLISSDMLILAELVGSIDGIQGVSPTAIPYTGPIALTESGQIKARARSGGTWSALTDATFAVAAPQIIITEIHYNPVGPSLAEIAAGFTDGDEFEFIELASIGAFAGSIAGLHFNEGIDFDFADADFTILNPGQRVILARNRAAYEMRHGVVTPVIGEYVNNLANNGEELEISDILGNLVYALDYDDLAPWPEAANDTGASLQLLRLDLESTDPANWTAHKPTPGLAIGDLDGNGLIEGADIDNLLEDLGTSLADSDLNADGVVDVLDGDLLIHIIMQTRRGDANLDRRVSIGDLTLLAEYFGTSGTWATGDFTGDGEISIGDLTVLAENFGFDEAVALLGVGDGDGRAAQSPPSAGAAISGPPPQPNEDSSASGASALLWSHIQSALEEDDEEESTDGIIDLLEELAA